MTDTSKPAPPRPSIPSSPQPNRPSTPKPPGRSALPPAYVDEIKQRLLDHDARMRRTPELAELVAEGQAAAAHLIKRLGRQYDPASAPDEGPGPWESWPGTTDRKLGNAVASVRAALDELADLAALIPARQDFDACVRLGGPFQPGLLPGRTVTAGSAAAGGSADGSGEVSGAGSEPPVPSGDAAAARPSQDAAAPGVPLGESPEPAATRLGAGDQLTGAAVYGFQAPRPPAFDVRPYGRGGAFHWPGTRDIARQVAEGARRRAVPR